MEVLRKATYTNDEAEGNGLCCEGNGYCCKSGDTQTTQQTTQQ